MQAPVRRRILKIVALLAALYTFGCIASAIFLAEITVHVNHRPIRHRAEFAKLVKEQFRGELTDVSVAAQDGAVMRAWYAKPATANGDAVILLHGVTDNREGVAGYAQMFLHHGYAVLLPDSRAHGESGGEIATYGVKERFDLRDWNRWLASRSGGCVYIFGESMGAALALQATAAAPNLCAVAVESPFAHFREIAYDRFSRHSGVGLWFARTIARPVLEFAIIYTRLRYKVDLTQADPADALAQSRVPALLIHGTADRNIPLRHSLVLVRAAGDHAQLWEVQGADHGGAVNVDQSEFEGRILSWFAAHNRRTEAAVMK